MIEWLLQNSWLVYLMIGALAGVLAGLLGIGGGFVVVPALLWWLPQIGVSEQWVTQVAVGTSLSTICITGLASALSHHKRGSVDWAMMRQLSIGLLFGAAVAGVVADYLPSSALALIFGIGACLMALQVALGKSPLSDAVRHTPSVWAVRSTSGAMGLVSGLIGIGGGSLVVPYLHYLGRPMTLCVGTASAAGLSIAVAGTLSFILVGLDSVELSGAIGYIYLPAFLGIIVASVLTAPLGVRLAHWLPAKTLKRVFAVFLLLVGVRIIIKYSGI